MHYGVCDYVLDIAQNACEAGARMVRIALDETPAATRVEVRDDGCGMDVATRKRALDPFRSGGAKHPGRKVGLGLPFMVQAVEQAGGAWSLDSEPGKGTTVSFSFPKGSVDSPPMGDIPGLFLAVLCLPGGQDIEIVRSGAHEGPGGDKAGVAGPEAGPPGGPSSYTLSKSELAGIVGSLERASSLALLKDFLVSQENG